MYLDRISFKLVDSVIVMNTFIYITDEGLMVILWIKRRTIFKGKFQASIGYRTLGVFQYRDVQ